MVAIGYALASHGVYQDDDLDHYFMARAALARPDFFLNPWGRPAFTILYALPAQLGLLGVRLFTIVVAGAAAFFTARAARAHGFRNTWAAAPLTLWQPTFFLLSFSALVEPLAALLVAILLDAHARRNWTLLAIAAGILPLARLELAVISAVMALLLVGRGAWKQMLLIALPLVLWALIGAMAHGDLLWLYHVVSGTTRPLTTSGPMQYVRNDIVVAGPAAFLGFFLGLAVLSTSGPGPRPFLAAGIWGLVFALLAALSWEKLHLGGSIGFLRHLIVAAPCVALLSLAGYEAVRDDMPRARRIALGAIALGVPVLIALLLSHKLEWDYYVRPGHDWSRLIGVLAPAAAVAAGVWRPGIYQRWKRPALPVVVGVVAALVFSLAVLRPLPVTGEQKAVKLVTDFIRQNGFYAGRPVLANHPWFYQMTGRDRWDRAETPYVTRASVNTARKGTVVVWDSHYGNRLYGDMEVQELLDDPRYRRLAEAGDKEGVFKMVAFERVVD